MSNYRCLIRTNYFHVKDTEQFKEFMGRVCGSEDHLELWEEVDADGKPVFGFGCYSGIAGIQNSNEEIDDTSYNNFIAGLQEHIADDDAIIIFEAGNEKLRYVVGSATVITSDECEYLDIADFAVKKVRDLLGNPTWDTVNDY